MFILPLGHIFPVFGINIQLHGSLVGTICSKRKQTCRVSRVIVGPYSIGNHRRKGNTGNFSQRIVFHLAQAFHIFGVGAGPRRRWGTVISILRIVFNVWPRTRKKDQQQHHFRRSGFSFIRGRISTKLHGRCRTSSCAFKIPFHASLHAPVEPGRAKIKVPLAMPAVALD